MAEPLILTLDAGGTNLIFSALKNGEIVGNPVHKSTIPDNLELFLQSMVEGFQSLSKQFTEPAAAISFAFPGPADYKNGVIGDLQNLPAFRGGVALGPYLEKAFEVPVYIHNDGDMFALGEAKAGYLPWINQQLEAAGSTRRYRNIAGITLGTGFGNGIVIKGELLEGDTGTASEGWLLRNKVHNYTNIEDIVSRRAVKRMYAEQILMDPSAAPEPEEIYDIARGAKDGVREAAVETWMRFGEALGDGIAHILTLIDGVVVLGGGLSGAYDQFSGAMMDELRGVYRPLSGSRFKRLIQDVYNTEREFFLKEFLKEEEQRVTIPGSTAEVKYQSGKKIALGLSRLGTDKAVMLGCYYYALNHLNA